MLNAEEFSASASSMSAIGLLRGDFDAASAQQRLRRDEQDGHAADRDVAHDGEPVLDRTAVALRGGDHETRDALAEQRELGEQPDAHLGRDALHVRVGVPRQLRAGDSLPQLRVPGVFPPGLNCYFLFDCFIIFSSLSAERSEAQKNVSFGGLLSLGFVFSEPSAPVAVSLQT